MEEDVRNALRLHKLLLEELITRFSLLRADLNNLTALIDARANGVAYRTLNTVDEMSSNGASTAAEPTRSPGSSDVAAAQRPPSTALPSHQPLGRLLRPLRLLRYILRRGE